MDNDSGKTISWEKIKSKRPHGIEKVVWRKETIEGEPVTLVFSFASGEVYAFNDIGTIIWKLCDGTNSVDDISRIITQEFDAPISEVKIDLIHFLKELSDLKLIKT